MTPHYILAENFFDEADAIRAAFDSHFGNSSSHNSQHQVWNYWYVPGAYTYLRTQPAKIMPEDLVSRFMARLNKWSIDTLGLSTKLNPWLSLYVNGCGQTIHNDASAGQMGFVYSITKWEERNFLGGETILFHPTNYWQTERIKKSGAGTSFYELVPSKYNQLLVFDDRVIHGVQTLQGTMNPVDGRVVLHGHLKADSVTLSGPILADQAAPVIKTLLQKAKSYIQEASQYICGFLTVRLKIQPNGQVSQIQPLCDRLLPTSPSEEHVSKLRNSIATLLNSTVFPSANGESFLTLPFVVSE